MKLFAFTMDLESDYAGCINSNEIFSDLGKIEEVLSVLTSLGVKITVFTVGQLFETFPQVIRLFEKYDCEFEAHSYSHDFANPDSDHEVARSRETYINYFGRAPKGYRAPRGDISASGIKNLEKHGFLYDSSVIPSFFPNPFKSLSCKTDIHFCGSSDLLEIPVTAITPFRILLSVSYIKMLGINFYKKISNLSNLPEIICFDSHLHDFIYIENSHKRLFFLWKLLYGLNRHKGIEYCADYLKHIKRLGYEFCYMSDIHRLHGKTSLSTPPTP